jgi:hypothetical protein
MRVRLLTSDGRLVTDATIPPFNSRPDVLIWGQRVFTHHAEVNRDGDDVKQEYREAFSVAVIEVDR